MIETSQVRSSKVSPGTWVSSEGLSSINITEEKWTGLVEGARQSRKFRLLIDKTVKVLMTRRVCIPFRAWLYKAMQQRQAIAMGHQNKLASSQRLARMSWMHWQAQAQETARQHTMDKVKFEHERQQAILRKQVEDLELEARIQKLQSEKIKKEMEAKDVLARLAHSSAAEDLSLSATTAGSFSMPLRSPSSRLESPSNELDLRLNRSWRASESLSSDYQTRNRLQTNLPTDTPMPFQDDCQEEPAVTRLKARLETSARVEAEIANNLSAMLDKLNQCSESTPEIFDK